MQGIVYKGLLFLSAVLICTSAGRASVHQRQHIESEHFHLIYWKSHEYLVPTILLSAEGALRDLKPLFQYTPSEKIWIVSNDYNDYGAAGTSSIPHNYIRLDIAPLELDYETIPFKHRLRWLLSHELIHVIISDVTPMSSFLGRSLFSKVPPQSDQPFSLGFSLLTGFNRYSPEWHQESIALFMETWLNGGYGRLQGNFDEMFFRSLVYENEKFARPDELDAKIAPTSFLLQMQNYLYGARFSAHLADRYGTDKFLHWFRMGGRDYEWFDSRFERIFGIELVKAWQNFIRREIKFQRQNLRKLRSHPYTPLIRLTAGPLGWTGQPHLDRACETIYFCQHDAHQLAAIRAIDLRTKNIKEIGTLPTPRLTQVAAMAIEPRSGDLFYTTNNNVFHRDLWGLNPLTGEKSQLLKNIRLGDLDISEKSGDLWGIMHTGGRSVLARSAPPYRHFDSLVPLGFGTILQHLSISPDDRLLAATCHKLDGSQKIVLIDVEKAKKGELFFHTVSDVGSPEHPSWNHQGTQLFWNAYVNGVSNIYRYTLAEQRIEAISHTPRGLFRPIALTGKLVFAFEFTSEGFMPVVLANKAASHLPAIAYFGHELYLKQPALAGLDLESRSKPGPLHVSYYGAYNGFRNLRKNAIIPIVTGFQDQIAVGLYGHFSDPLLVHELKMTAAVTPHRSSAQMPRTHLGISYEYRKKVLIEWQHNAPYFYDLFNKRKRSMAQDRINLRHTHYWLYDMPKKIKHENEVALYLGARTMYDNIVPIEWPDFLIYQQTFEVENLRRSIGSVDYEQGQRWSLTLTSFHVDMNRFRHLGGFHFDWEMFTTWAAAHNILAAKLSFGARYTRGGMALGKFYFGGFGNREIEDADPQQYRQVFRFPGARIYSLDGDRFLKFSLEDKLPPLRFGTLNLGHHSLTHMDAAFFSQFLLLDFKKERTWFNAGTQINIKFKHWYNLESTLSIGVARAWNINGGDWRGFVSFKPFR